MKRLMSILLVLCLALAVGCTQQEAPEAPEQAPTPAAPEPAAPTEAPMEDGAPEMSDEAKANAESLADHNAKAEVAEGGELLKTRGVDTDIGATVTQGHREYVTNVQCGAGRLSFTLTNQAGQELIFRRISALESSEYNTDQIAKLLVNGRHMDPLKYCGLNATDGKLGDGVSVTCSGEYVAGEFSSDIFIRTGLNEMGEQMQNRINIKAGENVQADFLCSE